jgi:hypothetical protein
MPEELSVMFKRKFLAAWVVAESVNVIVTSASVAKSTVAEPVIASPKTASPRFTLVAVPHVPEFAPVSSNSILSAEYVDAIFNS